jgi:hypothetical protein
MGNEGAVMDWETFYIKWTSDFDTEPTYEDYQDYLFDMADLALGRD